MTLTDLRNLSIVELRQTKRLNQQKLKKEYTIYKKKRTLVDDVKKIQKVREKINPNPKPKPDKIKTFEAPVVSFEAPAVSFEDYFQECIKNKTIPPDTPSYLRKALERALKEYDQGIIKEKSALDEFANKYIIKGEPGITPYEFLRADVCKYRPEVGKMNFSKNPQKIM